MKAVPYASAVGILMYAMLCTWPDICFAVGVVNDLVLIGYTDSDFQSDRDSRKSTSGNVFTLGGGAISWRSIKQTCVADSTMEAEYVAASEIAKEAEPRSHKRAKHIERKYNLIRDIVQRGDVVVTKIASENNLADPFTKSLPQKTFDKHVEGMCVKIIDA
ncbi:secreted RxLR effector protein 161-like [Nicotiana tabacum]|uniref:Secreted RxLR effector protein 161-like n=1 Tax=Nicotiana tabacum TaxID=4097 RepID=A0AC58UPZ6_TOBAC